MPCVTGALGQHKNSRHRMGAAWHNMTRVIRQTCLHAARLQHGEVFAQLFVQLLF